MIISKPINCSKGTSLVIPVVKESASQCRDAGLILGRRTKISSAMGQTSRQVTAREARASQLEKPETETQHSLNKYIFLKSNKIKLKK